jgi:hypothetical protein
MKNIKLKREGKPHMLLWIFAIRDFDSSYINLKWLQVARHHHLWSSQIPLKFSTILQNISHPLNPICDYCNDNTPSSSLNWSQNLHVRKTMIAQAFETLRIATMCCCHLEFVQLARNEQWVGTYGTWKQYDGSKLY